MVLKSFGILAVFSYFGEYGHCGCYGFRALVKIAIVIAMVVEIVTIMITMVILAIIFVGILVAINITVTIHIVVFWSWALRWL